MNSLKRKKNKIVVCSKYSVNDYFADTIREFESELIKSFNFSVFKSLHSSVARIICAIYKRSSFFKSITKKFKPNFFLFSILMGVHDRNKLCPYFLLNCNKSIYIFDAWQPVYQNIIEIIEYFNIDFIFFSAKQPCDFFKQKYINKNIYWIPEGITIQNFRFATFQEKDIDVIQIGRKYDLYHERIIEFCDSNKISYYYEKKKGEVIFPIKKEFIDVLSRTKISICIPSDITHPDRSGNVSTMTARYLQSMASKCLILGILPYEMRDLFVYNPIIEINMNNPTKQLKEILDNYSSYTALIERNYIEVQNKHQWANRAVSIKRIIAERTNIEI